MGFCVKTKVLNVDTVWLETTTTNEMLNGYSEEEYSKRVYEPTWFKTERVTNHSRYLIGSFCLISFPGNGEIVVVTGVNRPQPSHDGLSDPFRLARQEVAKLLGYQVMLETVDMTNYPALGSFMKIYRLFCTFISKVTSHPVSIGIKVLK